ncbi:MAG: hypothetical protein ACRDU8_02385 [Egibacteraceae bacterium]
MRFDLAYLHGELLGGITILAWLVVMVWSVVIWRRGVDEAPRFWKAVSLAQVLLGVQLLFGVTLLVLGRRPGTASTFDTIFHPLYGFVFPIIVLLVAHAQARGGNRNAYATFALGSFVVVALTLRAYLVGLGG